MTSSRGLDARDLVSPPKGLGCIDFDDYSMGFGFLRSFPWGMCCRGNWQHIAEVM